MTINVRRRGIALAAATTFLLISHTATNSETLRSAASATPQPSSVVGPDSVLGSRVVALDASRLPRWGAVQSSHRGQSGSAEWRTLLAAVGNVSGQALYSRVNQLVNDVRYVADRSDSWRTPVDFLRNGGDCEDYAIAKYMLLKAKGVPTSSMRILMIPATATAQGHSVLVVQTSNGPIVLDNQRSGIYPMPRGLGSRANYAFNESNWWVNIDSGRQVAGR